MQNIVLIVSSLKVDESSLLSLKLKQQEEMTKSGKPLISTGLFGPIPPQPIPGGMSISA